MTHAILAISWPEVLWPSLSLLEKIARSGLIYVILLGLFRVVSRRELAQATLFDFLIVLLISNVVQNAMIGNDNSIMGAAIGAVTLIAMNSLLNHLTARNKRTRVLLEGKPILLLRDGNILHDKMHDRAVSRNDLLSAIRKQGIARLSDVAFAILELDGSISIIKAEDAQGHIDCLPADIIGDQSAESSF